MLRCRAILIGVLLLSCSTALAQTWIFESGDYTHDENGVRVNQYEELPTVERIPFREFFSEDGPHPFGMDYWTDWYHGGWFDFGGFYWDGIQYLPPTYPMFVP